MGELILADGIERSPQSPPLNSNELLVQELEAQIRILNRSLEDERLHHHNQTKTLTEEISNLRRDHEICENENCALRKERDYWQKKSMESTEGMKVHDEVLAAAFHSLRSRITHLSNEARSCRLLEENGGAMKSMIPTGLSREEMPELVNLGSIDANLEETLTALMELENELIPIVSKLHSSYTQTQTVSDPSILPSKTPKISLSSFEENDLALFFPTPKGDYLAFNCGAPHHYLSAESKALIGTVSDPFLLILSRAR